MGGDVGTRDGAEVGTWLGFFVNSVGTGVGAPVGSALKDGYGEGAPVGTCTQINQ